MEVFQCIVLLKSDIHARFAVKVYLRIMIVASLE